MYTKHDHSGQRATAIGLAAGLGGGALLLAIAGLWGMNKASEARQQGVMALTNANGAALSQVIGQIACERSSREAWQNQHAPTISQYVDVQNSAGAGAGAGANALATKASGQTHIGFCRIPV